MIQSPHSIVFTPHGGSAIELVPVDGWLESLPSFEASQGLFESDGILLSHGYFRPLGNVVVDISFSFEVEHADRAEGLDAFLSEGPDDLMQVTGSLSIAGWVFEDAVLSTENPDLPSGPTSTTTRAYQVKTSLPIPPAP